MTTGIRRLVLVGGGHAHLETLRRAAQSPLANVEMVLVSPYARHIYSSTMPAQLREGGRERDRAFDLAALCRSAGARFVEAAVDRVDGGPRPVVHAAGEALECDVASLDVGSVPAAFDTPGAREYAHAIRPLAAWRALLERIDELAKSGSRRSELGVVVVGGGAGGIELALALEHRFRAQGVRAAIALVEKDDRLVQGRCPSASYRLMRLIKRRGVRPCLVSEVTCVERDSVMLDSGMRLDSSLTVWVSGSAAPPLIAASTLPADDQGFLLVDPTLRSVDGSAVWGGGDCVTLQHAPWAPKSGVIAVREGPILAHNLRAAMEDGTMRRYDPQRHAMAILDTSAKRGFLIWRRLTSHSRWALSLKSNIDRRFLNRYSCDPNERQWLTTDTHGC